MNDQTREERRSALDEFASASLGDPSTYVPATMAQSFEVIAAQPVAVHRDEGLVLNRLRTLAQAAGSDWYYRFPVKNRKENRTDWIEGPSIKLANDLSRLYGNCAVDCRAQDLGDFWLFHARFVDLESGYSLVRPFQQRKSAAKIGGTDDERRLDIGFQIGASKAIRNVVVNALQTFADFAFEEAKGALIDRIGKDLENYRQRTIQRVGAYVDIERVERVIGRPRADWLATDVAKIIAMAKAVSDGMATWNETFPPQDGEQAEDETGEGTTSDGAAQTLDDFAEGSGAGSNSNPQEVAGTGSSASDNAPSSLAEDIFETVGRRMAAAPTEAAVHEIWEQMELDAYFDGDKKGRDKAWKIASKRLEEIRKAGQ
ncbi:hypothetical protein [Sinorhizobium fredii]|uniref:hypothetical protein n=1 Tax=Rhizobium fredii TaxID=380 RepID=UPI0004AC9637|nr:hypothetical protein [Sinorhizobium fredii]